ncbi:MAG TPA: helix-turn-helix domain-containing protein [Candidatus Sulfomarinibacteraceae bacterium]|nr:helix-turn-helix domain-containing protein [Candidatus Sulfomarinibacteraceae bacterium]
MLTVPEVARRVGRNPETVRRWIREGKLRASKVGTQHVVDEADLQAALDGSQAVALPPEWRKTFWGGPMPDWAALIREQRNEH